jgi:hypothetical protein
MSNPDAKQQRLHVLQACKIIDRAKTVPDHPTIEKLEQ